jgi:hypothetical protein
MEPHTAISDYRTFLAQTGSQKSTTCIQHTGKFEIMLDTRNTFCGAPKESSSKVALIYLLNGLLDQSMERLSHIGLQDIFSPNGYPKGTLYSDRFVLVACHDAHICGYRPLHGQNEP